MKHLIPKYRKVGGLHFIRVGRFSFSWCLCRKPVTSTYKMS
jgi:hypothetical protein